MRSNSYTLIFTSCITIVLSFFLSIASGLLKEKQIANVELDRKKNILIALGFEQSAKHLWKPKDIQTLFSDFVQEFNIDENGNRIETTSIDHESSEALTYFQIYKKVVKDKIEGFAIPISGKGKTFHNKLNFVKPGINEFAKKVSSLLLPNINPKFKYILIMLADITTLR